MNNWLRQIVIIYFSFACAYSFAQTSYIIGKAPDYKGEEISLYGFTDLITYTTVKESFDTIDAKGNFELSTNVVNPSCYHVKINNKVGKLYMLTMYKYAFTFLPPDTIDYHNPNAEESVDLMIHGDSTELNARIIDFNIQFDNFWQKNYKYFVAKKIHGRLDTFQLRMEERYKNVKSNYFKTYMRYTFAIINDNTGRHRNYLAAKYLVNHPIEYHNYEYMEFFNQFFKQYLQTMSSGPLGNDILASINIDPNYKELNKTLKADNWVANDTLRELVIIKGLYELYYVPRFSKANITALISEINATTKIKEHKIICGNILRIFQNLQAGATAPDFALPDVNGNLHSIADYKGRYVYMNFFSPTSTESIQELKKMEQVKTKYGDKVIFISICMTGKDKEFKDFVKKNPKYNWLFLNGTNYQNVLDSYMIKAPNVFYLVNKDGYLVQSPATKPSEGIEFKFKEIFKDRRR
ncbi:MAG: TlpA family protein disulfide reductase [Bacteroidetes bacterium]|nr:TlpA family protein disulfide reductase [Bacteroidota bacterium]